MFFTNFLSAPIRTVYDLKKKKKLHAYQEIDKMHRNLQTKFYWYYWDQRPVLALRVDNVKFCHVK